MNIILAAIVALVISMAVIPLMVRLAPVLGMVDLPDPRKVHSRPIPRVGGIGIVCGALAAVLLFLALDKSVSAYVFGSVVLLLFGSWDDCRELGHYVKFIGQFIAVLAIVYWGDVWVSNVPFWSAPLPDYIGKPFTVFAIVGTINAINHSDGLDGLAGGETLLSLASIAYLAHVAGDAHLVLMACAVAGGVFGFLRFNTYPAKMFMGDSGSQFLGFSLAVMTVILTQTVNPALSMALPALILGLPVIDILAVFAQRIYHRMNWFRATKNHVHHRLLELGFDHYQAVLIIYLIQTFFTLSSVVFAYESDSFVSLLYLGTCLSVFTLLFIVEKKGWRVNRQDEKSHLSAMINKLELTGVLDRWPTLFIRVSIPIYFLLIGVSVNSVPKEFESALWIIMLMLITGFAFRHVNNVVYLVRVAIYGASAFLVYVIQNQAAQMIADYRVINTIYFSVLSLAIALVARFSREAKFAPTTMDFLMVVLVIAASIFSPDLIAENSFRGAVVELVVLFYGCELVISRGNKHWSGMLSGSATAALGIIGLKLAFFY